MGRLLKMKDPMLTLWNRSEICSYSEPWYLETSIQNKIFYYSDWHSKGIRYINDLLNENSDFYTWREFNEKYEIDNQHFKLLSVIHAIPRNWKKG